MIDDKRAVHHEDLVRVVKASAKDKVEASPLDDQHRSLEDGRPAAARGRIQVNIVGPGAGCQIELVESLQFDCQYFVPPWAGSI